MESQKINAIEQRLERIEALLTIAAKDALDTEEAALLLGIGKSRLSHITADRQIPHYKHNGKNWYSKAEITRWLLNPENRHASQEEIEQKAATYVALNPSRRQKRANA